MEQQLRAIKIAGRITNDRRLEVSLPPDVGEGEVEVIILVTAAPPQPEVDPDDRARWLEKMRRLREKIGPIHPPVSEAVLEERAEYEY